MPSVSFVAQPDDIPPFPAVENPTASSVSSLKQSLSAAQERQDPSSSSSVLPTPRTTPSRTPTCPLSLAISRTERRRSAGVESYITAKTQGLSSPISHDSAQCRSSAAGSLWHPSEASFFSSDSASSNYLTPPPCQDDHGEPPYQRSNDSSDSLTMENGQSKEAWTRNKCSPESRRLLRRRTVDQDPRKVYWWLPACQLAPSALPEFQNLCRGSIGDQLAHGSQALRGKASSHLMPPQRPSTVVRRWSSVEIGSHHIYTFPRPSQSVSWLSPGTRPTKSPTIATDGGSKASIIKAVRNHLTQREVPLPKLPATITLRRASTRSESRDEGNGRELNDVKSNSITQAVDLLEVDKDTAAAYLVTSHDIDSVTNIIIAGLQQQSLIAETPQPQPPATLTLPQIATAKRPSVTSKGLLPVEGSCADAAVTAERVQSSFTLPIENSDVFPTGCHNSWAKKLRSSSCSRSQNSIHEVIWQDNGLSPGSSVSACSITTTLPEKTPVDTPIAPGRPIRDTNIDKDFDWQDTRTSIEKWVWSCPPPNMATSNISKPRVPGCFGSLEALPTSQAHQARKVEPELPTLRTSKSHVTSFPALRERTSTNDWITPLPDISHPQPGTLHLYAAGIDATMCPDSALNTVFQAPSNGRLESGESEQLKQTPPWKLIVQPPGNNEMADLKIHRKSVAQQHPNAPARAGRALSIGSSLGVSSGGRRKSSAPHIRITDKFAEKLNKAPWRKPRVDSPYPSISLESSAKDVDHIPSPAPQDRAMNALSRFQTSRAQILNERSPPLPGKVDRAGIYNEVTGSAKVQRGSVDGPSSLKQGGPHDCDDCANVPNDSRMPSVDWIG